MPDSISWKHRRFRPDFVECTFLDTLFNIILFDSMNGFIYFPLIMLEVTADKQKKNKKLIILRDNGIASNSRAATLAADSATRNV